MMVHAPLSARFPFALAGFALLLLATSPQVVLAQDEEQGVLTGRAMDLDSEEPVISASVELLHSGEAEVSVATDSQGRFRFENVPEGTYEIRGEALGYESVETPSFEFVEGDTTEVVLWMDVDAVPLAPLEIRAEASSAHQSSALQGFYDRKGRDMGGRFLTRDDVEQSTPARTSDLLQRMGGFQVTGSNIVNRRLGCVPSIYLDGMRIFDQSRSSDSGSTEAFRAVNLTSPSDVEGIEVYMGPSTVPGQFLGPTSGCGVILIWTRRS